MTGAKIKRAREDAIGPAAAGPPFGYLTNFATQGPCARVVYRGTDGHIWELISLGPGRWGANDLTQIAGGEK